MVEIDPDWWKNLFDETYLITDARSVCDHGVTCREVDFLETALKLEKTWPILDLCGGQGRHSLELSRRGFEQVTVVDYSRFLIDLGKKQADDEGLNTRFLRKDARKTGLASESFMATFVMASSLGYFKDDLQNEAILHEACRVLLAGGTILLDLPSQEFVLDHFSPQSWHETEGGIVICRQRRVEGDIICGREMVISKKEGLIRDADYCTRLYSEERIREMLISAGFDSVSVQEDFVSHEKEGDYGLMNNRMITIARKSG
ncbi:MAG: class I SAM-dependent methyltransferase [Deltaproteobacteria bacterium]|nr:class I SAM-dependent methyltransferase [Deltaproteobacteria bacterium]MBW2206099.1 class I SAM-dependent methyltransferase [Deltaproteobacteria bacterium]